jgi:RimJ/RimL family protein N-acetyltransferase
MSTLITTDRLLLNPLMESDGKFVLELVNTDGWLKFIGNRNVTSEADATAYIQKIINSSDINYWVIRLKGNNIPIGIITFIKRAYLTHHDIGFALLPAYENRGYAYEATEAVLYNIIQSARHHTHISAITNPDNSGSIKLLKKLGFEFHKMIKVEKENLQVYEASADRLCITEITNSFFSAFTNKRSEQPNVAVLKDICIPEVIIVNKNRPTTDVFNLISFIEMKTRLLTDGTLLAFEEKEIFEETKIIKDIATRFSEYEKKGIVFRQRFHLKGYKIFQFVKIKKSWKICSILWMDNEN